MKKRYFVPFRESFVEFVPTYKMERDQENYKSNSKKVRTPSWTDRILTYCKSEDMFNVINYDRMQVLGSDHRPVYLYCECKVKKIDTAKFSNNSKNT